MKTSIIFVHGLGGGKSTWGKFPDLIKEDSSLNVTVDFMEYPTPYLGLKFLYIFQSKYQSIQDLAKSLKTIIDEKHSDSDEVILVGHSMGGLVIRKYLLEEKLAGNQLRVRKIILYAVPNRGSGFATLVKQISLDNPHLCQLSRQSDFINLLNDSWSRAKIEALVDITLVVAGNDEIVTIESAEAGFQHLEPKQIAGKGHLDIVKPTSSLDMTFIVFRNAVLKKKLLSTYFIPEGCNLAAWQKYPDLNRFKFQLDEKRQKIFKVLQAELLGERSVIRIKGLSGLGKTRLVLEAVLSSDSDVKEKMLYVNVASEIPNIRSWLKRAIDLGYQGILIVDNCKPDLHKDLCEEVGRVDSKIVLITLDHELSELAGANEYIIEPLDSMNIKAMLEPDYGGRIFDLDRVAAFAQGFPKMAVLIADARLANDPQVGKLNDDELARALLGKIDKEELGILRGCALFDRFGIADDVSDQLEYISEHVVKVSPSDFYRCIKKFEQRGLIDISGRFGQVVPKPLAVRLASEWWNGERGKDQLALINGIPPNLIEPFCDQIRMLGFLPEIQELTQTLCGIQGPFGQAEVILSNRGSRLLRSFVEVNPEVTSAVLYRVLRPMSNVELRNISGDVRRNLVWALERLAFHSNLFEQSAWCLMLLASAENESWGNNATGMFSQLFRVNLSGTEADFEIRQKFLHRASELSDQNIDAVVLKALNAAVSGYGHRTIGAEYQGNKPPLEEWRPKFWQEIFDYWDQVFDMLLQYVAQKNDSSHDAKDTIGHSIRPLIINGRVDLLNRVITSVVLLDGRYWPSALESVKTALCFDANKMPKDGVDALNNWLNLLTPDKENLLERLKIIVVNPPWEHKEDDNHHYVDVAANNAEELAVELSSNISQLVEHIPTLLEGQQKQTFVFGRRLAIESPDSASFIDDVLALLKLAERPNLNLAKGLLSGVYANSAEDWNRCIEAFSTEKTLIRFYPDMICTGQMQLTHLTRMLSLIREGQLHSGSAVILSYGSVATHLSSKDISTFCLELSELDDEGAWVALDIMFMYCFGDSTRFAENKDALKSLVTRVPLNNKNKSGHGDMYHWSEVVKKLLPSEGAEFGGAICRQLISATSGQLDHGDVWHYIKPSLIELMKMYGENVWPIWSKAILSADVNQGYWLQQLLERESSFTNIQPSIFSVLPINVVIDWCNENIQVAPIFVAQCINIFEKDADENAKPTALFLALLENFGAVEGFGGALAANLGSKGWSGSLVPYLESDRRSLAPLLSHSSTLVRLWVTEYIAYLDKCISHETMRDDEHKLGVY